MINVRFLAEFFAPSSTQSVSLPCTASFNYKQGLVSKKENRVYYYFVILGCAVVHRLVNKNGYFLSELLLNHVDSSTHEIPFWESVRYDKGSEMYLRIVCPIPSF